jgi:hypothetical protein
MDVQVDATKEEVAGLIEARYIASKTPVRTVKVMGKCTVAGWAGCLEFAISLCFFL